MSIPWLDRISSGSSFLAAIQCAPFQLRDCHVKIRVKSFRIPEFFVEVPRTATVGSLKRVIMQEATTIIGDGLHADVLLQGKKVRGDNKTLLQAGIPHDSHLDFILEPNPSQYSPPLCPHDCPSLVPLPCNIAQPTRYSEAHAIVHQGPYNASVDPTVDNLDNFIGGNYDLAESQTGISIGEGDTASTEVIALPFMSQDALDVGPLHVKCKASKNVLRRNAKFFSVSEVKALVQAVEEFGTGRWQEIKRRAFSTASDRTHTDLKDKWRNLMKTANKPATKRRGVVVPQELLNRVLAIEACRSQQQASKTLEQTGQSHGSSGGKTCANEQDTKEDVDLKTLLIICAQSVAASDFRTASEQLKQIREHSSPFGDGTQRLAHIFANGLEARLASPTGTQIFAALASKRASAAEFSVSPFKKNAIFFANYMILSVAGKARKIHIIDFGILNGFQWPNLIKYFSQRPGGPPKLRITGIELPKHSFWPAEWVDETGRHLVKYCERFKVPFEYHAIAKQWETIQIEDFRIERDEMLAVNCLFRFKNLLDETVVENNPRDAVLNLIRKMNPDIFLHAVVNGSYNAPFFVSRFQEALFHYGALFEMFDTNIPSEDQERLLLENEFFGSEVMNVIACEGLERVERPETYKQWQVRDTRAGFRLLPLNQAVMDKVRAKVKTRLHRNLMIGEDGGWMLQGCKDRIVYASSCWIPA
ncbi:hypothetical protein F0562_021965 [Nyssa sinensis]|uniref:HTH myb-type domain-containing protein n=1 Tax=Nyssa sinensis TaxID=561372 RepID=A0A5J5BMB7_9ASTE|nr:hypothetical protein F0562_021965 [Nyssa sinensis]